MEQANNPYTMATGEILFFIAVKTARINTSDPAMIGSDCLI